MLYISLRPLERIMISFKINQVPVLFIRGFTPTDVQTIIDFVRNADNAKKVRSDLVLFIDTPENVRILEAVQKLQAEGYRVIFRDHHELEDPPSTESDRKKIICVAKLRQLLGDDCRITNRRLHPACSTLVQIGEFKDALAIIADPDADGLTAAMKAAGIYYDGLDDDAAKLDGEPSLQVTGSPLSCLLAKGVASLRSYDPKQPDQREKAQAELFQNWVAAVQGDTTALAKLEAGVSIYDAAVATAQGLAETAKQVAPGVVLADVTEAPEYDAGTLTALLEKVPGCRITVLRKRHGPIAAVHQVQYSLAVAKPYQKQLNLKHLLPANCKSDPQFGIITNVSFLLHASQGKWDEFILPALKNL